MGIRYYAWAFDGAETEQALEDPGHFISSDPLADAWGFEPGAMDAVVSFEQSVPKRDMLYLDKAWWMLQQLTSAGERTDAPRPAFRMFEGHVTHHDRGWDGWIRALAPATMVVIARDLASIDDRQARACFRDVGRFGAEPDEEADYGMQYLTASRAFVAGLVADGRGMVYTIR